MRRSPRDQKALGAAGLEYNPERYYICGVDLIPYHTNYVMTDLQGHTIVQRRTSRTLDEYSKTMEQLEQQISNFLKECGIPREKLLGVGIAVPGLINGSEGKIYTTFKADWTQQDPAAALQMIVDDKVLYGYSAAGEIGHMMVQRDGQIGATFFFGVNVIYIILAAGLLGVVLAYVQHQKGAAA